MRLTGRVALAMMLGLVAGNACHTLCSASVSQQVSDDLGVVVDVFLRLIRMIIAPLIFGTLVTGIAGARGTVSMRRMALQSIIWFMTASFVSLAVGMVAANVFQPGRHLMLSLPHAAMQTPDSFDVRSFVVHIVPSSLTDAMARNDILQIVVFAALFGIALTSLPEKSTIRLTVALSELVHVMLRLTDLVMRLAPFSVFAALFALTARSGFGMMQQLALFVVEFYAAVCILWLLLVGAGFLFLGLPVVRLLRIIAPPFLLAFSTASSEAALPLLIEKLEEFGVPKSVSGFVLPLGYAFNLDGAMLFQSFAALFIAQAYGIAMSPPHQILMLLMLMVTSKGMAGVPRAAIVALTAILPAFGIPDAGLLLILGIDQFLDMARSGTNVIGNAIATAVVTKWADA